MTDKESGSTVTTTAVIMGQSDSLLAESAEEVIETEEREKIDEDASGDASSDSNSCGRMISSTPSCSSPLEWSFIDFTKAERCPIFDVDPVMLKKFIGHNVTVLNSSNEKYCGCCLTIDPVSLSVILARRTVDRKIRIITLPGYNLTRIYVDPNCVPREYCVSVNDLDIADLYHARSLFSESSSSGECKGDYETEDLSHPPQTSSTGNSTDVSPVDGNCPDSPVPKYSTEDIQRRKDFLKSLLAKNFMPCTEKGGALEIPGGVRILPPFTTESCDTRGNRLIQGKLGELIETMNVSLKKLESD